MTEITIKLADLTVLVKHELPNSEYLYTDYLSQGTPDIVAAAGGSEELEQARRVSSSPEYAESLCIYRCIAEQLPFFNRFLFHGAAISFADQGYLFTAPSGTGKTTHILQWLKYLGNKVRIVNGDKPIIAVEDVGVTVYGTPWAGKENFQRNRSASLAGLCFLQQGKSNSIRRIEPSECLMRLMRQVYLPQSEAAAEKTLALLDQLVRKVPLYLLTCDISADAVRCSFETMTGYDFNKMRIE